MEYLLEGETLPAFLASMRDALDNASDDFIADLIDQRMEAKNAFLSSYALFLISAHEELLKKLPEITDSRKVRDVRAVLTKLISNHKACYQWFDHQITGSSMTNLAHLEGNRERVSLHSGWLDSEGEVSGPLDRRNVMFVDLRHCELSGISVFETDDKSGVGLLYKGRKRRDEQTGDVFQEMFMVPYGDMLDKAWAVRRKSPVVQFMTYNSEYLAAIEEGVNLLFDNGISFFGVQGANNTYVGSGVIETEEAKFPIGMFG